MILKGIVDRVTNIRKNTASVRTGLMLEYPFDPTKGTKYPMLVMVACWPEHRVEFRIDTRKTFNVVKTLDELAGIIGQIASNGNYQEVLSNAYNRMPAILSVEYNHFGRHYGLYRSLNK